MIIMITMIIIIIIILIIMFIVAMVLDPPLGGSKSFVIVNLDCLYLSYYT